MTLVLLIIGILCCNRADQQADTVPLQLELLSVDKIWDRGQHNAFTDLTRFKGQFFCVFREASGHVSPDGKIRVLSSKEGTTWKSSALISLEGYDLRDPKVVVLPDGSRLMINGGAAVREGSRTALREHSFVSFSLEGREWTAPRWVAEVNQWLWRVTWFQGKAYGVAYGVGPEGRSSRAYGTTLLASDTGETFSPLVAKLSLLGGPTEATLRFDADGTVYCLQRRDGRETNSALLGISAPPYKNWEWSNLEHYFGGPNFIRIPSGHWIAAGRFIDGDEARTVICRLDIENRALQLLLTLPSGGDTSYPGLLWYENTLWVSYYSSHEGRTSIYLARVGVADQLR